MYYMQKKCKFILKNHKIILNLRNNKTASLIWDNLPINSTLETWGQEIYFNVPFKCPKEEDSKDIINLGEIAYWPDGKAIAIGFGPTPISQGDEIKLAAECNIWADTDYELKSLKNVRSGEEVTLEKFNE